MKLIGLDNKVYQLDLRATQYPMRSEIACRSNLQYKCGRILKQFFPFDLILEDFAVPGHGFYFDFFLPKQKLVVEIQGEQHSQYVPFFHKSEKNFKSSLIRDMKKIKLCERNDIIIITAETPKELEQKVNQIWKN